MIIYSNNFGHCLKQRSSVAMFKQWSCRNRTPPHLPALSALSMQLGWRTFPHRLQPDISGHTKPSLMSECACPEGLLSMLRWLSQPYWCSTTKDPLWCISCVSHTTPVSHQSWPQWVMSDSNIRRSSGNPELHRPIDLRSGYFTQFYNKIFPFFNCQSYKNIIQDYYT